MNGRSLSTFWNPLKTEGVPTLFEEDPAVARAELTGKDSVVVTDVMVADFCVAEDVMVADFGGAEDEGVGVTSEFY